MLAKKRTILCNGRKVVDTPFFIPSFSSKVDHDMQAVFNAVKERLTDTYLVSAYDLFFNHLDPTSLFEPDILFLDSGGYEALVEKNIPEELNKLNHVPQDWSRESFVKTVKDFNYEGTLSLVSYDHPDERHSLDEQIDRANELFKEFPNYCKEFLIKPISKDQLYLDPKEIAKSVHRLSSFDIIGVTDKELGKSLVERMQTVANIRKILNDANIDKPIHVFGSLDTVTSPLYFLAGADVFDGLTWLKFSFYQGHTVYLQTICALKEKAEEKFEQIEYTNLWENITELTRLKGQMKQFLKTRDYKSFKSHEELFEKLANQIE